MRGFAAAALALSLGLGAAPARAEATPEELAAARQLFQEAKELEKKNQWAEALGLLKKVAAVKTTPQVRFHMALCNEKLGRLVAAINGFELAAEEALKAGPSASEVAENAPARAAALRERVPTLKIEVKGRVITSRILLDDKPLPQALLGREIPVDPGEHIVSVVRGEETLIERELDLKERAHEELVLEVDDPDPPPKTAATAPLAPRETDAAPPSKLPVVVAAGLGVASLAGAGVFFALRQQTITEVRGSCLDGDRGCSPDTQATADKGRTYTTVAAVLAGVGGAGLATAGVLYLVLQKDAEPKGPRAPIATLRLYPGLGGASVVGRF